ncbi:DUF6488 family protein [Paraglaciecola polaris]|uniref:Uncharacterized protein n=1 Tax=Paraglaciecola polaris LMG 21857 TaxID=1129793 RepID=K6YPT5_9ALTE|nr:DUF6488 family protein [Paraglaciecola polaris]GAC34749.1 hypothetical protein GPLA_3869 [Paraglaciecola polaris LMG 21857]
MSVVNVEDRFYVVSANNTETEDTIYFQIDNNCRVMDVTHKTISQSKIKNQKSVND